MLPGRIPVLALAADAVAVVVFAAVGRLDHDQPGDLLGLAATVAPFAAGLGAAWATPLVRAAPAGLRAGAVVLTATAGLGLALRAAFTGRLPVTFAVVTVGVLGALLLGWRLIAVAVARRGSHPAAR